jgi:predicted permease
MFSATRASADYFNVFGVAAMLGRTFTADEDTPGRSDVVVISHRMWVSRFNGDRSVIGRVISIDGTPHTILGVMPASFDVMKNGDELWLPLALTPDQSTSFGEHFLDVIGRVRPGVSLAQAKAATTAVEQVAVTRMRERRMPPAAYGALLLSYRDDLTGNYRQRLFVLLGAVALVLLIACSNVANLLLARGTSRARELAIRAALGAGRGRLIRQLLTESFVLSIAGAVVGLGIAFALVRLVISVSPDDVPRLDHATIDWRVLMFTLTVSLASSILFGLVPALRAAGPRLQGALREGGRGSASTRDRLRGVFVVTEVALAIVLLVGSGLLIRSALLTQRVAPGFDPRGVLTSRIVLPATRYSTTEGITRTYRQIREDAARISGVANAALSSVVPLSGSSMNSTVQAEDAPVDDRPPHADLRLVSRGYFATMRIPLLYGRDIAETDNGSAPRVIVINEAFAKKLWPTLDPRATIGKRVRAIVPEPLEVVGVVGNLHDASLTKPPDAEVYVPFEQTPEMLWPMLQRSLVVVLRGRAVDASPETLVEPLRRVVASIDPSLPLADHRTMESYLRASVQLERMNTILLTTLGGIALVLAMVGIYGVVSYFVSQRTNEIGLRMALGATPGAVWQFVMRRGLLPIAAGLVVGVGLSFATTGLLRQQLYGVSPRDPLTLGGVAVLLVMIALIAMFVPARRAMRVPPIVALNER